MFASIQKAPTDELSRHDFVKLMCAADGGARVRVRVRVRGRGAVCARHVNGGGVLHSNVDEDDERQVTLTPP